MIPVSFAMFAVVFQTRKPGFERCSKPAFTRLKTDQVTGELANRGYPDFAPLYYYRCLVGRSKQVTKLLETATFFVCCMNNQQNILY